MLLLVTIVSIMQIISRNTVHICYLVRKTYFPHSVHKECPGEYAFSFSAVVRVESFFFPLLRVLPITSKLLSLLMHPVKKGATIFFSALFALLNN